MERVTGTEALRRLALIVWTAVGVVALGWAAIWVGGELSVVVRPMVLAVAVIYILNPLVTRLNNQGLHRLLGSCLSYLALLGVLTLAGYLVFPVVADQATEFSDRLPDILDDLGDQLVTLGDQVGVDVELPTAESIRNWLQDPDNQDLIREQLGPVFDLTLGFLEGILVFVLAPVLAFYWLIDLPSTRRRLIALLPARLRDEARFVGSEMGAAIGGFVRGQLFVALVVGILMSAGFFIIDLPFWLIIGLISGFLNIIPFVGPWAGGLLGALAGLTSGTPSTALWAIVVAVVVQQIDNHFISPTVLRTTVKLHPATIILALLAGGSLAGFFGILVAVPVAAVVKIGAGHLWRTRVLGESWEEAREELIEEHGTPAPTEQAVADDGTPPTGGPST